jgi:hypothetical protein
VRTVTPKASPRRRATREASEDALFALGEAFKFRVGMGLLLNEMLCCCRTGAELLF